MKQTSGVVWITTHRLVLRKWRWRWAITNLFYLAACLFLITNIMSEKKTIIEYQYKDSKLEELQLKGEIHNILRSKGLSLGQGIDIADIVIQQSKDLNLPVALILAVIKQESQFDPTAISSKKALGIMQINPITWNEYIAKLNLDVTTNAVFDPVMNIKVGTSILSDLYKYYKDKSRSEKVIWEMVLASYYAGKTSVAQTGIQENHRKYISRVTQNERNFMKVGQ